MTATTGIILQLCSINGIQQRKMQRKEMQHIYCGAHLRPQDTILTFIYLGLLDIHCIVTEVASYMQTEPSQGDQ